MKGIDRIAAEPVTELWFRDRWGELTRWTGSDGVISWGSEDFDWPESLASDAPDGWSVWEGTKRELTAEDFGDDGGSYGDLGLGDVWWEGSLRPATAAEVCGFFGLASPDTGREG